MSALDQNPVPAAAAPRAVVAYVRMSTEHQQYSTQNQLERIRDYAAQRAMAIVRVYADEGRSGLDVRGRASLRQLIADVQTGVAAFQAILVYDVSRWGRFQDTDESGYYEYLCRGAGITVHYCAEQFENDGSPTSNIIKSLKRSMAGEFSRELSAKVTQGCCRIAERGFKLGGPAGYGLRRMVVGADGSPKALLQYGEHKFLTTDRIVLVPGPEDEQKIVREIFESYVNRGFGAKRIVAELNRRKVPSCGGAPWTRTRVRHMLSNENYVGNLVYNRTSTKLRQRSVRHPPEKWIRAIGTLPAIVDPGLFAQAQRIREERAESYSEVDLLAALRDLWQRTGQLSGPRINADPRMPSSATYLKRFGSLAAAYRRIGYPFHRNVDFITVQRQLAAFREDFFRRLLDAFAARGLAVAHDSHHDTVRVAGEVTVAVVFTRARRTRYNTLFWPMRPSPGADLTLVARLQEAAAVIIDYYLFPRLDCPRAVTLRSRNHILLEAYRTPNLDPLLALAERVGVEDTV